MTLLVISPDYASHALPLLTIAGAWRDRGHRVVVASGRSVAHHVGVAGLDHVELVMSQGSNPGVVRAGTGTRSADRHLESFIAATRHGMLATLRHQAEARAADLLWRPRQVALDTIRVVEHIKPDVVLVDHLAFAATIGLRALGIPYGDVVLGHPTALPVGAETYGVPSAWPAALRVDRVELQSLRAMVRGVNETFSHVYDAVLRSITPSAEPVGDAFAAHGDLVLFNYPSDLHDAARDKLLPRHVFLGSAVRMERPDALTTAWLDQPDDRPLVVVALGTFLSARSDVLTRVAAALRRVDARVAMAIGANDATMLGEIPPHWLVRPSLPQVALLEHASLLVTHGGNNSVTEALTLGVPVLAMPFSSDQFDGAAAIERSMAGMALDPNHVSRPLLAGVARGLLGHPPSAVFRLSKKLRADPGPGIAYRALEHLRANGTGVIGLEPSTDPGANAA